VAGAAALHLPLAPVTVPEGAATVCRPGAKRSTRANSCERMRTHVTRCERVRRSARGLTLEAPLQVRGRIDRGSLLNSSRLPRTSVSVQARMVRGRRQRLGSQPACHRKSAPSNTPTEGPALRWRCHATSAAAPGISRRAAAAHRAAIASMCAAAQTCGIKHQRPHALPRLHVDLSALHPLRALSRRSRPAWIGYGAGWPAHRAM
jgi:hypothetical protein